MSYFESGDPDDKVAALNALGQIADPRSLPLARAALDHKNHKIKKAAKQALVAYDYKRRSQDANSAWRTTRS
jgi:HEAT repeat protein